MIGAPVEVRLARQDEVATLARVLTRAFAQDPLMTWLFRGHVAHLERFLRIFLMLALRQGAVYTTAAQEGAAIWFAPSRWKADKVTQLRFLLLMLRTLGPRNMGGRLRALDAVDRLHPSAPHYYLMALGSLPEVQGRGIGSALMAPILARADAEGMPAYLESSAPANVPFYEHRGFRLLREFQPPYGAPPVWLMWREPISSPSAWTEPPMPKP